MVSLVFVHGTGVRQPAYDLTLAKIKQEIKKIEPEFPSLHSNWQVVPCCWGDKEGTRLNAGGATVPTYSATQRDMDASENPMEGETVMWAALYIDPLCELRLLNALNLRHEDQITGEEGAGERTRRTLQSLIPAGEMQARLIDAGLEDQFMRARLEIIRSRAFLGAARRAEAAPAEFVATTARAIVAHAILLWETDNGCPALIDGTQRDALVEDVILCLSEGTQERGSGVSWLLQKTGLMASMASTWYIRARRGEVTDFASGAPGDVLMYQARGEGIRKFIQDTVANIEPPVILLAHSLGGIACVDLLIQQELPPVELLVTVGSQASYLYELNALASQCFNSSEPLPDTFPRWLNLYDTADFLSYLAGNVFISSKLVEDIAVNNKQPFPLSHSAYWSNPQVYREILRRIS